MSPEQLHAQMKARAMGWAETGVLLEAERRTRVRQSDTMAACNALDDAFESKLWLRPEPRQDSGMVQMQAIFARARR